MTDLLLSMPPNTAMAVCGFAPIAIFAALYLVVEAGKTVALALGYEVRS